MTRTNLTIVRNFNPGTFNVPERAIPDNESRVQLEILRCTDAQPTIWPSESVTVQINVEASYDGGQTWRYAGGVGGMGGIHTKMNGQQADKMYLRVTWPPGINRQMRATATIAGGVLRTQLTLETS